MTFPSKSQFSSASTFMSRVFILLIKINGVLFQPILHATSHRCLSYIYKVIWFILSDPDEYWFCSDDVHFLIKLVGEISVIASRKAGVREEAGLSLSL
jgi:hypothetical protein